MEALPKNRILKFNPDTLEYLRNKYGFDTQKRMNDAIDALQDWASKQEHFKQKTFDREFLERVLIFNKGSVEKSKRKIDKLCTLRTLIPDFFAVDKIDKEIFFKYYSDTLLSKMTPDHGRIHFLQMRVDKVDTKNINEYSKYYVLIYKYIQFRDYCNHVTLVLDWTDVNTFEYLKAVDIGEVRKACEIAYLGFSLRIKALHVITTSKTIDIFINLMKPALGPKLSERIQIHKTMDSLYEHIPKDLFPEDFGGKDKPTSQLCDDLYNELYSPEFTEHRKEMNKASTNEAHRPKNSFNEEYLGMSGTFRTLSVD